MSIKHRIVLPMSMEEEYKNAGRCSLDLVILEASNQETRI
jgi:hypothetical protein